MIHSSQQNLQAAEINLKFQTRVHMCVCMYICTYEHQVNPVSFVASRNASGNWNGFRRFWIDWETSPPPRPSKNLSGILEMKVCFRCLTTVTNVRRQIRVSSLTDTFLRCFEIKFPRLPSLLSWALLGRWLHAVGGWKFSCLQRVLGSQSRSVSWTCWQMVISSGYPRIVEYYVEGCHHPDSDKTSIPQIWDSIKPTPLEFSPDGIRAWRKIHNTLSVSLHS